MIQDAGNADGDVEMGDDEADDVAATQPKRRRLRAQGPREAATIRFEVRDLGCIVYYRKGRQFVVECNEHDDCKLYRKGYVNKYFPAQGRPLGFMMSWLLDSVSCNSASVHKSDDWAHYSYDTRCRGRDELRKIPGSEVLFAVEDPPNSEEPRAPL